MNLIKKTLSVCLAIVMGASSAVCVSAEKIDKPMPSGVIYNDSIYAEYVRSLSDNDRAKIREKKAKIEIFDKQMVKEIKKARKYKISIPGTFSIFHQIDDDHCVPACVQSILYYCNNSSPDQKKIGKDLKIIKEQGVELKTIPPYLNSNQNKCYYNLDPYRSKKK